jgi:hypothetical protein
VLALLTVLAAHLTQTFYRLAKLVHYGDQPIAQPGAEQVYLPANYSSAVRVLVENARVHGDVLFSLPGAYSFNLWSGVDTPTLTNVTHWFSLLNDEQQQAIIHRLETAARPVFIIQHNILSDVIHSGVHPHGPLMDYLRASFHRSFAIEGYSFWVRNGRSIAALSTGILTHVPGQSADKLQLQITVAPHTDKITRVELWSTFGMNERKLSLDETQTEVSLTPLNLDGTAAGAPQIAAWPWSNAQVSLVTLTFTPSSPLPPANTIEVVFINAEGRRVGSARILPFNGLELPPEKHQSPATAP